MYAIRSYYGLALRRTVTEKNEGVCGKEVRKTILINDLCVHIPEKAQIGAVQSRIDFHSSGIEHRAEKNRLFASCRGLQSYNFV